MPPPLIGEYSVPAVQRGERVTCQYRDRECIVTSTSDAPIPWPRVQACEQRGGSGLWVNDELAKAITTESAEALMYWFGVSVGVVWRWRKVFGVGGRANSTAGTAKAVRGAAEKGAAGIKAKVWTATERRKKSRLAKRLKLKPTGRWAGKEWTAEQVALLGTDHDEAVARRIGRTRQAVTAQRTARKIPAFPGWPGGGPAWTDEDVAQLGTAPDAAVAKQLGRTRSAVAQKRGKLKALSRPRPAGERPRVGRSTSPAG